MNATPEHAELLETRLSRLESIVEKLDDTVRANTAAAVPEHANDPAEEPFAPRFPTLQDWVEGYFCPMFTRGANTQWCAQWWDHAEVIGRLNTLWRCYEAALIDERAWPGLWLQIDHHLGVLFDQRGPFIQCTPTQHDALKALPYDPAPADTFGDVAPLRKPRTKKP